MNHRLLFSAKAWVALAAILGFTLPASGQPLLKRDFDTEGSAVREAFVPIAAQANNSVVRLLLGDEPVALGTVVGHGGLVLTKASELNPPAPDDGPPAGPGTLTALLRGGQRVAVERLAASRRHDLALLRIEAEGLEPVTWAEPAAHPIGRWLVAPGLDVLPEAIGIYSAAPREITGVRLGIRFGQSDRGPMIDYAIPRMGAAEAGLEPGDVIRAIAQRPTPTVDDVIDSLREVNAGDVVSVLIDRQGEMRTFPVEMRLRPIDRSNRVDYMNTLGNEVSRRRDGFPSVFQHDATIDPSLCGGPVLNLDGHAVGINIARAGRIETYALPVEIIHEVLAELQPPLLIHEPEVADPATPTH